MWCWELIKQGAHIIATDALSVSTFPPNLTPLEETKNTEELRQKNQLTSFQTDTYTLQVMNDDDARKAYEVSIN